jgi:trehalose synthase
MGALLEQYAAEAGPDVIEQLERLAHPLKGLRVVHVNSTRQGGGVAEILERFVPLKRELGLDVSWEVIAGNEPFFSCTKGMHNAVQGNPVILSPGLIEAYEQVNEQNAQRLRAKLEEADFVFVHDPQPAPLLSFCPNRRGVWIWRCHVNASHPYRRVWRYLKQFVAPYDASIFSLDTFAQALPHPQYLIPPTIDPLSEKNRTLGKSSLERVRHKHGLDPERPLVAQISRFDRFKDPLGVIQAYKLCKTFVPLQLVLAGGSATDDPEGQSVLEEVQNAAAEDPDIHVLELPPDAHTEINALQRIADIVLQKSTREGFGLTVTEAMWKARPVIGGDTGGIRLQVINHHTGFLVRTPEGAALRIRYLLSNRRLMRQMGRKARDFVRQQFLVTRHLREHLALMLACTDRELPDRIDVKESFNGDIVKIDTRRAC